MLLDTASLYFRAFYGMPETVTAPDGTPVNAIRGLLDQMTLLVRTRKPAALVACWDADWRPEFRTKAIPSYKAHRLSADGSSEEVPANLSVQIPVIEELLTAAGIAIAGQPGYEADDIIGTLAARSAGPVDVVTGDRDLFQLVNDERQIRIIYTVRGLKNLDIVDEAALINAFGSVDGIKTALDCGHGGFPKGTRDKLAKSRDYLEVAMSVVRVADNAPLPPVAGKLPAVVPQPVRIKELGERWGLGSSLTRFMSAVS